MVVVAVAVLGEFVCQAVTSDVLPLPFDEAVARLDAIDDATAEAEAAVVVA